MSQYGLNLGNFASQLDLNDQNKAAASLQQPQPSYADVSAAAKTQQPQQQGGGWDTTQKYMGAVSQLGNDDGQQKNGLQKVIGLVGLFA